MQRNMKTVGSETDVRELPGQSLTLIFGGNNDALGDDDGEGYENLPWDEDEEPEEENIPWEDEEWDDEEPEDDWDSEDDGGYLDE